MTYDDALEFSEALRAAFPRIRFLSDDYAKKFFNSDEWLRACDEARRAGRPQPRQMDFVRDPTGQWPDYFPSLADVLERNFRIWVEPPNWRPRWRIHRREDYLGLENQPRLRFTFWRGGYACPDPRRQDGLHGDPHLPTRDLVLIPDAIDRKEPILLEGHRMLGGWDKGDDVAKAFIHKVWRILDKMSTNRLVSINWRTFQPIPPDGSAHPEHYMRAALGALAWARHRRHNYLSWGGRGGYLYKPEMYFKWYRPSDEDDRDNEPKPVRKNALRNRLTTDSERATAPRRCRAVRRRA